MTARPLVAGNWKMNTTVAAGVELARAVAERCAHEERVEVAVLPPFTHLWPVHQALAGSAVRVGAQDVYWEEAGAFTGEVSPAMLAGWCDMVLVGHSERRHVFGETDEETARKFAAARRHGLRVIVAVGETGEERDDGRTFAVVDRQLDAVLAIAENGSAEGWVVAYEPVWAIGTGHTASPAQAQEVCAHVREHVAARLGAEPPRVLYGGSVNVDSAAELFRQPDIGGGLIGGASLAPDAFAVIVAAAAGT